MRIPQHISKLSLLVIALSASTSVHALDLIETWALTRAHDPQMAVVQATRSSAEAFKTQAASVWRPNIGLNAITGKGSATTDTTGAQFFAPSFGQSNGVTFGTSIHQGTANRWSLSAKQPLYNPERNAQQVQLQKNAELSILQADLAQQNLMLTTVQRYFEVLVAERKLAVLQKQYNAVTRAWTEAKDRYALGDAPVTDMHEAAARASGLQAQVLAADGDAQIARAVLADATGLAPAGLKIMPPKFEQTEDVKQDLNVLLTQAQDQNLGILMQLAGLAMAQQEVRKHRVSTSATLDAIAVASHERLSGNGDFGAATNTQNQQMVGLSLTLPLYTGGWREGKLKESLSALDKATAELDLLRTQIGQQTRMTWLALNSGQAQVKALTDGWIASSSRLEATRLGRQVGDRTTQELLNAENDAAGAEIALLTAQTQRLLNRLKLDALTGRLSIQSLQSVNDHLVLMD
jgi:outer membrane protein